MIDITTLNMKFKRKKDIIIELLIEHYGREYEQVIKDRLTNLLIDFSSLPDQEYSFLQDHGDQLNERSKLIIESRYSKYEQIKKIAWEEATKLIYDYAEKNLSIKCSTDMNFIILSNLELGEGIIDSLGSKSTQILSNPNMPQSLKENILINQKTFKSQLGAIAEHISQQDVDKFIEYREQVQKQYQIVLIEKTKFCKNVFKDFVKRWETPIPAECYTRIVYGADSFASSFTITQDNGKRTIEPYIIMRYLNLKNKGMKCFDTNIVHEMIHAVEIGDDNKKFGLCDAELNITITNEVKTQLLAIEIVTKLHRMGVFILDDPNDYIIQGQSAYEMLFPIAQDFFERNEEIILACAIDNEPYKMIEYFGDTYKQFNIELNRIFEDLLVRKKNTSLVTIAYEDYKLVNMLIKEMENHMFWKHPKEMFFSRKG